MYYYASWFCIWTLLRFDSLCLSNACDNLDAVYDVLHKFNGNDVYASSLLLFSDVRSDYYVYSFIDTIPSRSEYRSGMCACQQHHRTVDGWEHTFDFYSRILNLIFSVS